MTTNARERDTTLKQISDAELDNPFNVLIATILSQRNRDERTEVTSKQLFQTYKTAHELAEASESDISRIIRPVNFYITKARRIKEVAKIICKEYGGQVPNSLEKLMELPGVGRKTANCVLVYGHGKPAIPVDTHVHRICNRLGLVDTRKPEETETALIRIVPKRHWLDLNEYFVRFGQTICKPIGPRCDVCLLAPECKFYKSRKVAVAS